MPSTDAEKIAMNEPEGDEVLGVFQDDAQAEAAARRARAAGVDESAIHVGEGRDETTSVRAEMQEEMENSFLSPQAAVLVTKEMTKALTLAVPLGATIGAALLVPFAFFLFTEFSLLGRLAVAILTGGLAGATVGAVAGGGLGAKGPANPLAAERGVTVRVDDGRQEVADALAQEDPLRLDRVSDSGVRRDTVTTQEERTDDGVVQDVSRKLQQEEGDWSGVGEAKDDQTNQP